MGPYFRVPIAPNLDFVWGRAGVVRAFRFTNLGIRTDAGRLGFYLGGTSLPIGAGADALMASTSENGFVFDLNLPLGLAIHAGSRFSLTLQGGYSMVLYQPPAGSHSSGLVYHYLPLGIEAVFSPLAATGFGVNVLFDGSFGPESPWSGPGYFDQRTILFWVRFRTSG